MVHRSGQIRICECNSAKRDVAKNLPRCRLTVAAEEKSGLWIQVSVAPAVQNDAANIPLRVETCPGKHVVELLADLPFVVPEWGSDQFGSSQISLVFGRLSWVGIQNL